MDPIQTQINKISSDITSLRGSLNNTSMILSIHKHSGQDQTSKLNSDYTRVVLLDQATIATDATLGRHFYVTLAGNRTLGKPTGMKGGQRILYEFIQDGTGSRTITLNSAFDVGAFTVTLTTTASKRDFMEAVYSDTDGKFYVISFVKGY